MRVDNSGFSQLNQAAVKTPRYVVQLSFDNANTDLLYLTSHNECEAPATAIVAGEVIYNVLRGISGQSQQIKPDEGNATIGGFSFNVIDKGEAVTVYLRDKLANGDGLRHKQVVIYVGYDGLPWSSYQPILTYIIDGVSYRDGEYVFKSSDIQRAARNKIFAPTVRNLSKTVTATQAHIPVLTSDLSEFPVVAHDQSYSDRPSASVGYARIEDEIFTHSGLFTHGTDGVSFQVVERGALNTRQTEHVLDESANSDRTIKITEHVYLEGPAPKIIYALATGVLYNQGGATLPDNWHLGISTSYVRLSDFTGIDPDLWDTTDNSGRHVRLDGPKETDGKKFIEKELLYWLGCFMPVYATGEWGLRRLSPVLSNSGYLVELDETNIVNYGDLKHEYGELINVMQVDWNHVFLKDDFTKSNILIDAASIAKHNQAPTKKVSLLAVHTGAHTDEDIASYFDTIRDRYSGPPETLDLQVLPSLNRLEVGDTVKVALDQIRDFNNSGGVGLDRVFEVQRVQQNWLTGDLKLSLFGSSQKAGTIQKTSLSAVLADAFYNSAGTELSTVLTISGGAVTASGSLTGGSTMAAGIYYYLGNLTINAGVTVTISDNVQLRVMGHLTINGSIDGAGQGLAGGAGATLWSNGLTVITAFDGADTNAGIGQTGYLGITRPGGHNPAYYLRPYGNYTADPIQQGRPALPFFVLRNQSTAIAGLPTDLRGSSGTGGGCMASSLNSVRTIRVPGTAGGNGGAGLMIISRGVSFGAGGSIDLSGDDAPANSNAPYEINGFLYHGSAGAGGAPGGLAIFLDGNHTPPDLADELISLHGDSPFAGDRLNPNNTQGNNIYALMRGIAGYDMGASAYTLQYIPEYNTAAIENDPPPPDVTGFTVGLSGSTVVFRWLEVSDNNLEGYEIRYSAQTVNAWDSALPLTRAAAGTRITDTAIRDGDWRFYIKARDENGQYSQNAATYDITVVSDFDIIESKSENPDWLRQNHLTYSENFDHASWTKSNLTVIPNAAKAPNGTMTADKLVETTGTGYHYFYKTVALDDNLIASSSVHAKAAELNILIAQHVNKSGTYAIAYFNLTTGVVYSPNSLIVDASITDKGDGWFRCHVSFDTKTGGSTPGILWYVQVYGQYTGDGSSGLYVHGAQATPTDYLTDYVETQASANTTGGHSVNLVKHWTGKLIPSSQNGPLDIDWPNETISNPYPTCTYETSELDVSFDDVVRASIETLGELFPGETGSVAITNYVDYKLAAGSYDGYEPWESGDVEARYIKFKFELDTTQGVAFINSCDIIADLIERVESAQNVAVSASGESIVFNQSFHVVPAVRADMVGGGAVFATVSNITTTGFDVDCYNTSGTGVSGTINWRAEGA